MKDGAFLCMCCPLQAGEHGLSERQRSRLAAHDQENRRRREEEERRRLEDERARREAEAEASPTFEDMEKMHYFRSQYKHFITIIHSSTMSLIQTYTIITQKRMMSTRPLKFEIF